MPSRAAYSLGERATRDGYPLSAAERREAGLAVQVGRLAGVVWLASTGCRVELVVLQGEADGGLELGGGLVDQLLPGVVLGGGAERGPDGSTDVQNLVLERELRQLVTSSQVPQGVLAGCTTVPDHGQLQGDPAAIHCNGETVALEGTTLTGARTHLLTTPSSLRADKAEALMIVKYLTLVNTTLFHRIKKITHVLSRVSYSCR